MSEDYRIQFLDNSGWRTCISFTSRSDGAQVRHQMEQAQAYYPGHRIRCVDSEDRVIDIL